MGAIRGQDTIADNAAQKLPLYYIVDQIQSPRNGEFLPATRRVSPSEMSVGDDDPSQRGEPRAVRILVSSRGAALGTLTGYVLGVVGFYTNFFNSILQATAFLVDTALVVALIALGLTGVMPGVWRHLGPRRTVAGTTLSLLLIAGVNYLGVRPPGVVPAPKEEICTYNVGADDGVPIPLRPGGSITQQLRPRTRKINSISVIAGLDSTTAHLNSAHPVKLSIHTIDGHINRTIPRADIVDNAFSRFEFPQPLAVKPNEILVVQVFNESNEPVSFYVKQPGLTDLVQGAVGWSYVEGHLHNERGYEKTGFVLSGCVTEPGT